MSDVIVRMQHYTVPDTGEMTINHQLYHIIISEAYENTYTFDSEGRFMMGFMHGHNYVRGLDNTFMMKSKKNVSFGIHWDPPKKKVCALLSDKEARALIDEVLARVRQIRAWLQDDVPAETLAWLDTIVAWDFEHLAAERVTFQSIYKPIGIVPPDHYYSVVLQATEGCSWNRCAFCSFYKDRPFRIKPPDEFRQHVQQVRQFFGRSIAMRRSVFLGDANALIIPQQRLLKLLSIVHEELPIDQPKPGYDYRLYGIFAFLDIFGAEQKDRQAYQELRDASVMRIYIGLETGDAELFKLLNKPGSPLECVDSVRLLKEVGIYVGVIILAGVGGERYYEQHVRHSLEIIAQMNLEPLDIVYLSPLVLSGEDAYSQHMQELGIPHLEPAAIMKQIDTFKSVLRPEGRRGPKVTLYDIQEFLY